MNALPIAFKRMGLVTSVGLSAPAACAAMREKLTNPSETRFTDSWGDWIRAHQVKLDCAYEGLAKLAQMAALAIEEALACVPAEKWTSIPLLLCVAEADRPGRITGLDGDLLLGVQEALGVRFDSNSAVLADGRTGVAKALSRARTLVHQNGVAHVLVAAVDSLVNWSTLRHYELSGRLLTPRNSNGFAPGEGAGALLVAKPCGLPELVCIGIGLGFETAHIDSSQPLRAEGLSRAICAALVDAGVGMHEVDYRIADLSGEHYYFKEAALALSRTLRKRKAEFDIWHPAECTGEAGALAGTTIVALADAACRKGFGRGPTVMAHMANDDGQRAALLLRFLGAE